MVIKRFNSRSKIMNYYDVISNFSFCSVFLSLGYQHALDLAFFIAINEKCVRKCDYTKLIFPESRSFYFYYSNL